MITSVGKILIDRRRALGLTLDDVAHASRVSRQNLRWLEGDEFTNFPNLAYALAFLRFYGGVLEMDVEPLMTQARMQYAMRQDQRPEGAHSPRAVARARTRRAHQRLLARVNSVLFAIALSVILAAAGLTVMTRLSAENAAAPAPAPGEALLVASSPIGQRTFGKSIR